MTKRGHPLLGLTAGLLWYFSAEPLVRFSVEKISVWNTPKASGDQLHREKPHHNPLSYNRQLSGLPDNAYPSDEFTVVETDPDVNK